MGYEWHSERMNAGQLAREQIRVQTTTLNPDELASVLHHALTQDGPAMLLIEDGPPMPLSEDVEVSVYTIEGERTALVVVTHGIRTLAEFMIVREPEPPPAPLPQGAEAVALVEQARALRGVGR